MPWQKDFCAHICVTDHAAVCTTGQVFTKPALLQHSWRWFSFDPAHGLYVRESVVQEEGLFKPPVATDAGECAIPQREQEL